MNNRYTIYASTNRYQEIREWMVGRGWLFESELAATSLPTPNHSPFGLVAITVYCPRQVTELRLRYGT